MSAPTMQRVGLGRTTPRTDTEEGTSRRPRGIKGGLSSDSIHLAHPDHSQWAHGQCLAQWSRSWIGIRNSDPTTVDYSDVHVH